MVLYNLRFYEETLLKLIIISDIKSVDWKISKKNIVFVSLKNFVPNSWTNFLIESKT